MLEQGYSPPCEIAIPCNDAQAKLFVLTNEQLVDPMLPFDIATSGEKILATMKLHPAAVALHADAKEYFHQPHTDAGLDYISSAYKGALFQLASYEACRPLFQESGLMLLSENATSDFEEYISGRRKRRDIFHQEAVTHYSLDGLVVKMDTNKNVSVEYGIEYTLNNLGKERGYMDVTQNMYAVKKIAQWQAQQQAFPEIFGKAKLLFVVPQDTPIPNRFKDEILVKEMPFNRDQFTQWMHRRLLQYRDIHDAPTLPELQDDIREKYNANSDQFRLYTENFLHEETLREGKFYHMDLGLKFPLNVI